jgi:hypothetical protein
MTETLPEFRKGQPGDDLAGTVTKSEFAAAINVSVGRVSQYITEGKLSGDALVGDSRRAQRIRVDVAVAQLRVTLDQSQMLGNGKKTRLEIETAPQVSISPATVAALEAAVTARFDRARDDVLRLLRAALRPGPQT